MPRKTKTQLIADGPTIRQAISELGINKPWYTCRVVGNRLEFHLYGGDLVYWPEKPKPRTKAKED